MRQRTMKQIFRSSLLALCAGGLCSVALAKLPAEKAGVKLVEEARKQADKLAAEADKQIEKLTAKQE